MIIEGALSYGGAPSLHERLVGPPVAPTAYELREQHGPWADHPDVRVARTLVPNRDDLVFGGVAVATDGFGLRVLGAQRLPGRPELHVVVLGGDDVFGLGEAAADTLVARTEARWVAAGGAHDLVLTPVALPGWSLRNAVALLGDHLDGLAPHAVVVLPTGEDLADTVGVGRDGVLGVQRDPLSELPWMRVGRARLDASLRALADERGWDDDALAGPWWLETGATGFASRRLDDVAALVAAVARRTGDTPWILLDDERGVLSRVHERLGALAERVALARLPAAGPSSDALLDALVGIVPGADAPAPDPVPRASIAALSPRVDLTDGRGARQLHGGLHPDAAADPTLAAVLRRDARIERLRLRCRSLADGPERVVVTVSVDGVEVGRALVERSSTELVDEVWRCAPLARVRACDVVLAADAYTARGDRLVSFEFVSLGFE